MKLDPPYPENLSPEDAQRHEIGPGVPAFKSVAAHGQAAQLRHADRKPGDTDTNNTLRRQLPCQPPLGERTTLLGVLFAIQTP